MSESNKIVVYAALFGNLAIALVKFVASYITNSSAMFSEAIHSVVDTLNEILLLYGMKKSEKPANAKHPFGYGRELYFWAFIVALMVLPWVRLCPSIRGYSIFFSLKSCRIH